MEPEILLTDADETDARAAAGAGLGAYNTELMGYSDNRPLNVMVRDPDSKDVLGGIFGRTSFGLFFLDLFYLPTNLRKQGLGSRLIRQAEDEARARGCVAVYVMTITIQAPEFYKRQGYTVFGELPTIPEITRIFLTKRLD